MNVCWVVETMAVGYWTSCEALGFITFPLTIFLMCLIWNGCTLFYWLGKYLCRSLCASMLELCWWWIIC